MLEKAAAADLAEVATVEAVLVDVLLAVEVVELKAVVVVVVAEVRGCFRNANKLMTDVDGREVAAAVSLVFGVSINDLESTLIDSSKSLSLVISLSECFLFFCWLFRSVSDSLPLESLMPHRQHHKLSFGRQLAH